MMSKTDYRVYMYLVKFSKNETNHMLLPVDQLGAKNTTGKMEGQL